MRRRRFPYPTSISTAHNTRAGEEIVVPTKFPARFASHCAACGGDIHAGQAIEGVRLRSGTALKWSVWHDDPACSQKAQAALIKTYPNKFSATPTPPEAGDSAEDELVRIYREEAATL